MTHQTTITIRDGQAWVDMPSPRAGNRLTADQSAALHALTSLAAEGVKVHYDGNPLATLAEDLLKPDQFGHSVTTEVRAAARLALSMPIANADSTALRVYLSGPMTGLPQFNFPAFTEEAAKLRDLGFDVVNPAEINPDTTMPWHLCMRADIRALCDCDAVALMTGWHRSQGAALELHVGQRMGLDVAHTDQPSTLRRLLASAKKTASA